MARSAESLGHTWVENEVERKCSHFVYKYYALNFYGISKNVFVRFFEYAL